MTEATEKKSIVPQKYAGKYKNGGADGLSEFINSACSAKDDKGNTTGIEFEAFFQLAEKNGVPQDKIDHYKALVASGARGAEGRARMTIGNMIRSRVRKNDNKVVGLDGKETQVEVATPAVSGAAATQASQSESNADLGQEPVAADTDEVDEDEE